MYLSSSVISLSAILLFFLPLKLCAGQSCKKILLPSCTKEATFEMIPFYGSHAGILAKT
jgi:hypothetical protein